MKKKKKKSCLDAGVKDVCREKEGLFENSSERPADVYLPPACSSLYVKYFENRPLCLDFAVTHTQQPSFLKIAGEHSGSAADRYAESVKLPRYEKKCKAHGLKFVPMVVSCFGAWCSQANPVFSFISKAAAHRRSWHPDLATIFLRQRLSVALQRRMP